MNMTNRIKGWLLPAALILFLLEIILFPFATQLTYAGRNESPDHVLTYTTDKLTWDSSTGVNPDTGVAELRLFNSSYQNVKGENGEKVVAPGTEAANIVRLKNEADRSITYIAVMYRMKEEDTLPVEPVLADSDSFADTEIYPLPEGVTKDHVVRAVRGSVKAGQIQDFDITWLWKYYENHQRDMVDTKLGNRAAWEIPDEVMAGLYIVVDKKVSPNPDPNDPSAPDDPSNPDNPSNPDDPGDPDDPSNPDDPNDPDDPRNPDDPSNPDDPGVSNESDAPYTYPNVPQTGDSSNITLYLVLMSVSGVLLLLLLLERRKEKQ